MSSKIILVTGGSRSGKSKYAEGLYEGLDDVLYIATAIITDEEMRDRVTFHQKSRNQNWTTVEQYKRLDEIVASYPEKNILLDCVTVMVTNLMFEIDTDIEEMSRDQMDELEESMLKKFKLLIDTVRGNGKNIVLVTNEVGCGLVPEYKLGRIFRDVAGKINQQLATWSDEVFLVACGLPLRLK